MSKETESDGEGALAVSFGLRLAKLRDRIGIDATELGRRAGMSQAYVWRLEKGRAHPNLRNLARLAQALEVSLSTLLEEVEYEAVPPQNRSYRKN